MDLKKLLLSEGQRTNTRKGLTKNLMEQVSSESQFKLSETITLKSAQAAGQDELKLFKGALFKVGKNRILVSNTKYQMVKSDNGNPTTGTIEGTVHYNCKAGKFYIPGKQNTYYNKNYDNIRPDFKKFCAVAKQTKSIGGGGNKVNDQKLNDYPCVTKLLKDGKGKVFDQETSGVNPIKDGSQYISFGTFPNEIKFFNNGRYYNDKTNKGGDYHCDGNKIIWSKKQTTPERTPGSGGAPTTQSQTPTLIKQIQKTIGVTETGKLTDTEIQTIYDKLNPSEQQVPTPSNTSDNQALKKALGGSLDAKPFAFDYKKKMVSEEINRIKEMMGIVLNEQTTTPTEQPEKTPTKKLQELLNTKFSAGLTVDGKMGPKTAQAIINALGKATVTTPTPSSTNQTSSGTPVDTKPTDNTSLGTPEQETFTTF
jgi:DNA uptake protein ComE-like DNA-binding protein